MRMGLDCPLHFHIIRYIHNMPAIEIYAFNTVKNMSHEMYIRGYRGGSERNVTSSCLRC